MPYINETIKIGNNTGRVKNDYANGLMVIYDIVGTISPGDTVLCEESGETIVLNDFVIEDKYDLYYEPDTFDDVNNFITLDSGEFVALDEHFTGKPSQDSQTRFIVRE